jgi:hypothetical protein
MNGRPTINRPLTLLSLTSQFILEIAALGAFGFGGYSTGNSSATHVGVALAAPLVAAAVWALVGAPMARFRLRGPSRLLLEAIFFGSAAAALAAAGATRLALVFAVVVGANIAILDAVDRG